MQVPDVEERRVCSFDDTELAYHVVGEGPPLLLCNGLGGSWRAFSHQIAYLAGRYRLVSWDYRGLYASGVPRDPEALRVEDSARDAEAILAAEGIERAAVVGWSMGVQVALELFRLDPSRVAALVLLNGVAGRPFDGLFGVPAMRYVAPPLLRTLEAFPGVVQGGVRRLSAMPDVAQWVKRMGLSAGTVDEEVFQQLVESFRELDMGIYLRTLRRIGEHDATDLLAEIDVLTLMIAGERDILTPTRAAEELVRRVAGADLMVVAGGTHYVAVEYPELVNLRVEKFLQERGYGPEAA